MVRAKRLYEAVFQLKLKRLMKNQEMEMWSFPMAMDRFVASGALVKMEGFPSGGNSTLVYFSCADCAVEAGRVAASGGHIFKTRKYPSASTVSLLCVLTPRAI